MSIHLLIGEILETHPSATVDEIVKRVTPKLSKDDLRHLIETAVQLELRQRVSAQESSARSAFRSLLHNARRLPNLEVGELPMLTPKAPTPVTHESLGPFRALLWQPFAIGDGSRVTWGDATREQHKLRIAYLEKKRSGLADTIGCHRDAIAVLDAAGVSCLAELETAAAQVA